MSGHSKWSKIKHQKATGDAKKGKLFSKLSRMISLAAQKGDNPDTNLELKYAINQAKSQNMPAENIQRAIKRGSGTSKENNLEEVLYEAFGPGGVAIIISGITDNKNRTFAEVKKILADNGAKLAEPGAAVWAFEKTPEGQWRAKNKIPISEADKIKIKTLISELQEHEDIQNIKTNMQ